jgi:hypothetical protein
MTNPKTKQFIEERGKELLPKVDVQLAAEDVKTYILRDKFNQVDYDYKTIEMYPPPGDEELEELSYFAKQFSSVFDFADEVTGKDGENFPEDLINKYEDKISEVARLVNADKEFWAALREEVVPLYEKSDEYDYWKTRWVSISMFYDPVGMDVVVTKRFTNADTGKVVKREPVSKRSLPAGFAVKIH